MIGLAARIGAANAQAWFAKAEITALSDETLTLQVPTSFIASKIRAQFEPQLLECASACVPAIKQVKVVCQKEKAA